MSLEERVAKLEVQLENDKKSFVRRFSVWAGLIALAISIVTGSYNIFDQFYFKPEREKEEALQLLRSIVSRLSDVNWRLVELQLKGNAELIRFVGMVANGEKVSILSKADDIVSAYPHDVGFSEYIVLAQEHLNWGNFERALAYANAAHRAAEGSVFRMEASRYKARALFAPGPQQNIGEARQIFSSLAEDIKAHAGYRAPGMLGNVYEDWIIAEMYFGECARARELYAKLISEYDALGVDDSLKSTMVQAILQIASGQYKCRLEVKPDTSK